MPFDFKNRDRIEHLLEELQELRYRNLQDVNGFYWWEDDGTIGNREPQGEPRKVSVGFQWKGWDRYNWLTCQVEIPEALMEEEVVGLFDFGAREGTGNNGDFESLLYLNGKPYQAMDGNHREVFLEPKENGRRLDLKFRLWSGLNGGGRPKEKQMEIVRAQIGVLDHPTDDLYFLASMALEAYDILDPSNEYREWILNVLVQAFRLVDYTDPGSESFYRSTEAAYRYLDGQMDGRGKPDVTVDLVGHTHIDVAWLWRLRHTREKAARSFSTVNRLMEKYDHYIFLQSQPQLYEYIKEDYPDIYEHIKKRVKEGRWEPSGAMWVECDCNIASGESIIRQILVGKNFFRQEFGYESEFLWLPDVFGYSWALPQILKKSGVDTFMTTKISWNDTNRLPYDTFLWKGIDGTGVTAHFVTTSDPGEPYYTYNGNTSAQAVKSVWDNYRNKDTNRELLISYGFGDGGGGPTRQQIKQAEAVDKIPGLPHVEEISATEYFRKLNKTLKENPMDGYLPVWDGELYLEFHRGTYTSQAYNKKMNRRMEYSLRDTELFSVMAALLRDIPYDKERILRAWKIVLCHQFHDILPGSSIREVYEDSHVEYEKALALIGEVAAAYSQALYQPEENCFAVFNNSGWVRTSLVRVPAVSGREGNMIKDGNGNPLPTVWKDQEALVLVKDMAPFSFVTLRLGEEVAGGTKTLAGNSLVTPWYEVKWNEAGQLTRIYDRKADREILPEGGRGNVLQVFEDKPRAFDAWELEPTIDLKREEVTDLSEVSVREHALGWEVDFVWNYHNSCIRQTMCLYREKKRIDFKTTVDWKEHQKVMKTCFPMEIRAVDARFDIQDGNIRRPITRNTSWESAKFEVVAHKWVDLWETGYGVALLNDCKYGHDIKEGAVRLTLLKSAIDPDYCADNEIHEFTYSLLPHDCEWYEAGIEQEAFDLNNVLTAKAGRPVFEGSLFAFDRKNVSVDAVKMAENGSEIVLRFHEFEGARGKVTIRCGLPVKEWCLANLMEEPESAWSKEPICLPVKPYEIVTVMLRF